MNKKFGGNHAENVAPLRGCSSSLGTIASRVGRQSWTRFLGSLDRLIGALNVGHSRINHQSKGPPACNAGFRIARNNVMISTCGGEQRAPAAARAVNCNRLKCLHN